MKLEDEMTQKDWDELIKKTAKMKIKKCPFCGSKASPYSSPPGQRAGIACDNNLGDCPVHPFTDSVLISDISTAIKKWNTRAK